MIMRARKILGLAIEQRSILAVEIRLDGERFEVKRAAEFVFPEEVSFDEPTRLGQLLRQFLREYRFVAKYAVLGIPAKWLIVREKNIPPTNADALAGILKIQAERDFSLDFNDLALDYSGEASSTENSSLLLVAALRRTIDQIVTTAQAAGLSVLSVTSSALALASTSSHSQSASRYVLYIRPDYVEFLVQSGKYFRVLKHLPVTIPGQQDAKRVSENSTIESLVIEVSRLVSLLSHGPGTSEPEKMFVWDAANLGPGAMQTLSERLSPKVEVIDGSAVSVIEKSAQSSEAERRQFAAAAALGLAGARPELLPIDFLHSRISPRKSKIPGRLTLWAAAVGMALILCGVFLFWDLQKDKEEVAALKMRLEQMQEDIEAAQSIVDKVSFARGWYSGRPKVLDCLRGLTLAFPTEGRIWATSLAMHEDKRGIISGKSLDEISVLEVLDTLKGNGIFSNVKMLYMRDAGRDSQEVSFAINFIFVDRE